MTGEQIFWLALCGLIVLPAVIKFTSWLFTGKWPEFVEDRLPLQKNEHYPGNPSCLCLICDLDED